MFDPSAVFYMDKIVTGPEGRGVVDLNRPIGENIRALARAKRVAVEDLQVAVLVGASGVDAAGHVTVQQQAGRSSTGPDVGDQL